MGDYHSRSHEHDKKFWPRCIHRYNLHYNKYKNIIVKVKLVKKLKIIPQNNNNNIFSIKKYKIMSMIRDMGTAYSMIMSFTLCPYYTNHLFLKNFNSNPWLYLYIKSLSSFKVQNRSSNLLVLRILLCYVQYLKWVFRCSVFEQVILFFATFFPFFSFSKFWVQFFEKCMQRQVLFSLTCRISLKIFSYLKSIVNPTSPILRWYFWFLLYFALCSCVRIFTLFWCLMICIHFSGFSHWKLGKLVSNYASFLFILNGFSLYFSMVFLFNWYSNSV